MPESSIPQSPKSSLDLLASIRIDQSFTESGGSVRKPLMTVPIRKPSKNEFVRVHPDHHIDCYSIELKEEREHYFVVNDIAQYVLEFIEPVRLRLTVTRQGTVFLWPVKLPRDDRRGDTWRRSALEASALAEKDWVRIAADMGLGAYQPYVATADYGDPKWPAESWEKVTEVALKGRLIDSLEHTVVRDLLGQ